MMVREGKRKGEGKKGRSWRLATLPILNLILGIQRAPHPSLFQGGGKKKKGKKRCRALSIFSFPTCERRKDGHRRFWLGGEKGKGEKRNMDEARVAGVKTRVPSTEREKEKEG